MRWVVETGRPVRRAISVTECALPERKVANIAVILATTDRGGVRRRNVLCLRPRIFERFAEAEMWTLIVSPGNVSPPTIDRRLCERQRCRNGRH